MKEILDMSPADLVWMLFLAVMVGMVIGYLLKGYADKAILKIIPSNTEREDI